WQREPSIVSRNSPTTSPCGLSSTAPVVARFPHRARGECTVVATPRGELWRLGRSRLAASAPGVPTVKRVVGQHGINASLTSFLPVLRLATGDGETDQKQALAGAVDAGHLLRRRDKSNIDPVGGGIGQRSREVLRPTSQPCDRQLWLCLLQPFP